MGVQPEAIDPDGRRSRVRQPDRFGEPEPVGVTVGGPVVDEPQSLGLDPSGPVACDPLSTKLSVTGFQSVKTKGKQTFSLGLTNNTAANCVLTLSPSTYVLKVSSGNDRIWTTADCTKLVPVKKTTLKPGASYEFKIDWTLKRSKPGCKLVDKELGAGTYVATASFQSSGNARFVMQLKK
ncbi:MAG: DUF4232 domain-containing protein [Micropruina sp.]|nr:MAG: DUF4232 domain-containing protein [Micropruina sp.]